MDEHVRAYYEAFWPIVERDLANGQHRSPDNKAFTTAFFHRVEELQAEVVEALTVEGVYGSRGRDGWYETRGTTNRPAPMSCTSPAC